MSALGAAMVAGNPLITASMPRCYGFDATMLRLRCHEITAPMRGCLLLNQKVLFAEKEPPVANRSHLFRNKRLLFRSSSRYNVTYYSRVRLFRPPPPSSQSFSGYFRGFWANCLVDSKIIRIFAFEIKKYCINL